MPRTCHAAVDLGAGSGRVLVGSIDDHGVRLEEAHRFAYAPRRTAGHLRWDMASLLSGLRDGLRCAHVTASTWNARLESVGVDSWGVDYGLIDGDGRLLEDPICYRDERTAGRHGTCVRSGLARRPVPGNGHSVASVQYRVPAHGARRKGSACAAPSGCC